MDRQILIVCDTLKQADNLFDRSRALLHNCSSVRMHSGRREIRILNRQSIRFTSKKHYEQCDKFGFTGKLINGNDYERDLDREERYMHAFRNCLVLNKEFNIKKER